jgi:cell wall-associated NlpC family hydrolase
VLGELSSLDANLEKAVEAYNYANVQLQGIQRDLNTNTRNLGIARTNLGRAQTTLSQRLVTLYTTDSTDATLEVLLGSSSLDELLTRLDSANSVSQQDASIVREVIRFRTEIRQRAVRLKHAKARQADIVQQRANEKASIQQQLAQRQALLSSIRGEIAHLRAVEAARQAQLRAEAAARLATQQQAAAAAALAPPVVSDSTTASPLSAPAAATPLPPAPPPTHSGVVGIAMQYLGVPYRWGGADPSGFDCSGFVMYVYSQMGVSLPHSSYAQYGAGSPVAQSDLQPGDLVFFDGLGHVGIYIGGGQFIHAPHTGDVVKISSLSGWYAATYVGARRI